MAGATVHADTDKDVMFLKAPFKLLVEKVTEALVIYQGGHERYIIIQAKCLKPLFIVHNCGFTQVAGKMSGGGCRATVAADKDLVTLLPGLPEKLHGPFYIVNRHIIKDCPCFR